jgi:hypothetical protein
VLSFVSLFLICTVEPALCNLHHGVIWYSAAPDNALRMRAAQRYDVGITGLTSGSDRQAMKDLNPGFRWFVYNSISDNYVPPHNGILDEHQLLSTMASDRGIDIEEAYLHFWDNTRVVLQGDTVFIPGWGGGSATDPAAARVPVFYSTLVRRATNFSTPNSRQLHKDATIAMLLDVPFEGTSLYADGIFFDNSSGRLFNAGTTLSGGHIREAPNHATISSTEFRNWYFDAMATFLSDLKNTMETSSSWSKDGRHKEIMINIADVWDDQYVTRDVADILFLEFSYNPVRDWGTGEVDEAYRRDQMAAAAGITSFYSATMTKKVSGHEGEYDFDDTMLGNYAWFLISRTQGTLFYQQGTNLPTAAGWDTLTWRGVMDVAPQYLGEAIGAPYTIQSGTDPMGHPYEVKARDYEGGLVVLRNRGSWSEGIEVQTAVNVSLPASLTRLAPDGTPSSSPVSQVTLRNGQGAIFVSGQVPVTLLSFTATRSEEGAHICWETASESADHAGFHVYREGEDGTRGRLTSDLLTGQKVYEWVDPAPPQGEATYWLAELTRTGETTWYGPTVLAADELQVSPVLLAQNRPNPFRGSTTIRFTVSEPGPHSLVVFDVQGREVARLLEGNPPLGTQELLWDGRDQKSMPVAPGIYFYHLQTPSRSETRKMMLAP